MFQGKGSFRIRLLKHRPKGALTVGTDISIPKREESKAVAPKKRRDGGFSLIEIMAGMAIIAILAMAVLPQFSKYFERAAIQNLSSEMTNAAMLVQSDHSLTGKSKFTLGTLTTKGTVAYSVADTQIGAESKLEAAVMPDRLGYTITGTNDSVTNYTLVYYGGDHVSGRSGLVVSPQ